MFVIDALLGNTSSWIFHLKEACSLLKIGWSQSVSANAHMQWTLSRSYIYRSYIYRNYGYHQRQGKTRFWLRSREDDLVWNEVLFKIRQEIQLSLAFLSICHLQFPRCTSCTHCLLNFSDIPRCSQHKRASTRWWRGSKPDNYTATISSSLLCLRFTSVRSFLLGNIIHRVTIHIVLFWRFRFWIHMRLGSGVEAYMYMYMYTNHERDPSTI